MSVQHRSKKSTASNAVKTMQMISTKIEPTLILNDQERIHFDRVVISREADTWSPHDITIACQLAKALLTLEKAQAKVDEEGLTLVNERGTVIAHPLLSSSMTMSSTIQALTRTLGLNAASKGVSGPKQAVRNQAEQKARQVIERAASDDLLA